jgi:hypothetical protein
MRVQIVGNFQSGRIKTIQGWNSKYQEVENARQGPGIKLSITFSGGKGPSRTWNKTKYNIQCQDKISEDKYP